MTSFRFVHIAPYVTSGGWRTLQRDDYYPLRWPEVEKHQEELAVLMKDETMIEGGIGDKYSDWHKWDELPPWAKELLESIPL